MIRKTYKPTKRSPVPMIVRGKVKYALMMEKIGAAVNRAAVPVSTIAEFSDDFRGIENPQYSAEQIARFDAAKAAPPKFNRANIAFKGW